MRALIVNAYACTGGAARAAHRLHTGLGRVGVDSSLLYLH